MIRQTFINLKAWKPSVSTALAVLIVAGAVAFALLQNHADLTGNSISTESASLAISQNDSNYSQTAAGYAFTGVIPGLQVSQTEHFFLKNTGSASLTLNIDLAATPTNPSGDDLSKVHILLTPYDPSTGLPAATQDFTLQALLNAGPDGVPLNYPVSLAAGLKEKFDIQMNMDDGVVSGTDASLSNIDLGFTGLAAIAANNPLTF